MSESDVIDRPTPSQRVEPTWYSISTLPENERVILRSGWGEATGWMSVSRRGRPVYYRVGRDGRPEQLAAFATPSLWRPQNAATWPYELPEPATVQPEPDPPLVPPAARRKGVRLLLPGELPLPTAIAYSPPHRITLEECEARLLRALKTDRYLPDRERAQLRVRVFGLDTEPAPGDWPAGISTRWSPFPQDTQDYLVAMAWFAALTKRERMLIKQRAMGWSFVRIGDERGRSDEWAKQQYLEALVRAWRSARGEVAEGSRVA
jgi:hypothetical protein